MTSHQCVVLNNLHDHHIGEFADRCAGRTGSRVVFQYGGDSRTTTLKKIAETGHLPVPIYLVPGSFGSHATAVGLLLLAVEYHEDLPASAVPHACAKASESTSYGYVSPKGVPSEL